MTYIVHEEPGIKIYPDMYADRPDFMLGTLAIRNIGDEEPTEWPKDAIVLPVYRYEHGRTLLNTTGFSCPWDSAMTGYIYVTKAKIREEYGWKRITAERAEKIKGYLREEVNIWSNYFNGENYGYELANGDSCWGFYSFDHCLEEARANNG